MEARRETQPLKPRIFFIKTVQKETEEKDYFTPERGSLSEKRTEFNRIWIFAPLEKNPP